MFSMLLVNSSSTDLITVIEILSSAMMGCFSHTSLSLEVGNS